MSRRHWPGARKWMCGIPVVGFALWLALFVSAQVSGQTIEVLEVVLEQVEGEALVVFRTTGPPRFRERVIEGGLVIELRDAVAAPSVGDLVPPSGVVEAVLVRASTEDSSDGETIPLLEFEIRARGPHTAGASFGGGEPGSGTLEVRVLRRGQAPILGEVSTRASSGAAAAVRAPVARRPAASRSFVRPTGLADMSPEAAARAAADQSIRSVFEPAADASGASPGTRLESIELLPLSTAAGDDDFFALRGDGPFRYETLRLQEPPRLVIDLGGVVNQARLSGEVSGPLVSGVRIAQFRSQPDPVTRVVFDLREAAIPLIERQGDGLSIRLVPEERVATLEAAATAPARRASGPVVREVAPGLAPVGRPATSAPLPEATRTAVSLVNRYGEALRSGDREALEKLLSNRAELWEVRNGEAQRVARGRTRVARTLLAGAEGVHFGGMIAGRRLVGLLREGAPGGGELDLLEVNEGMVIRVWSY